MSIPKLLPARARDRHVLTLLTLLLVLVTACAPAPGLQEAEQPPPERVVSQLDDGRQGFRIDEQADLDTETRNTFSTAVDALEQARYEEAIPLLQQVIERAPQLTAPQVDIAIAYAQTGEAEKAEGHLKRALELIPGHPVASNVYGLLLRKQGRFTEARDIYEHGLEQFPMYLPLHKNLGILYELYLGDDAAALKQFELFSEDAPGDEQVQTWIASLRQRLANRN